MKKKNTTLSVQFQNLIEKLKIPHCQNSAKSQEKNCRKAKQTTRHENN